MWFFSRKNRRDAKVSTPRPRYRLQIESLEDRCLLSAGMLDPTFGTGGIVTTDLTSQPDMATAVVVQTDGKILTGGQTYGSKNLDFGLVRYNANGSLDTTFGSGGKVITAVGSSLDKLTDLALQTDGKIVAGGSVVVSTVNGYDYAFALARYNANGTLDTTFGGGKGKTPGIVTTNLRTLAKGTFDLDNLAAIAIQTDGKIVAVGRSGYSGAGTQSSLALVRYNANGSLDTTFGSGGIVLSNLGKGGQAEDVVIDTQGRIVVVGSAAEGTTSRDFTIARYTPSGSLDTTFGANGVVYIDFAADADEAFGVTLQADGKIVVAGYATLVTNPSIPGATNAFVAVARLDASGNLDPSFGTGGKMTAGTEGSVGAAVAVDGLGNLVIGGTALTPSLSSDDLLVMRLTAAGQLDSAFGNGGITVSNTAEHDYGNDMALQADGKIVVVGNRVDVLGSGNAMFTLMRVDGDAPLQASGGPAAHPTAEILPAGQMEPLLDEAIARWNAAGVDTSALANVSVQISNLSGAYLGLTDGKTIWLDDNAAGYGWFVDTTPSDDSEFFTLGDQGEQGRMDLLTVVEHELGHMLGFDHQDTGVMVDTLATSTRYVGDATTIATPSLIIPDLPPSTTAGVQSRTVTLTASDSGVHTFPLSLKTAGTQSLAIVAPGMGGDPVNILIPAAAADHFLIGDCIAKTGTLTFAPGEITKKITIEVKGDSKKEADETFGLELYGVSTNALLIDAIGIGTILNDD